jgi:hypothetical protein
MKPEYQEKTTDLPQVTEGLNPIWLPCLTFSCNTVNDHWFGKINHYPFSLLVLSCHPATC